jgi:16S rRNA (uracil1498-N3)-methyltransferase
MQVGFFFHSPLQPGPVTLSRDESVHAAGARRLRPGQEVWLVDGQGHTARGVLRERSGSQVRVEISRVFEHEPSLLAGLRLATSLPKGRRQSYLFEKCAELGVGRITATNFARSVAVADSAGLEKWTRTCREAIKQSHQPWAPRLEVCPSVTALIDRAPETATRLVAVTGPDVPHLARVLSARRGAGEVWAVIGPEGGLTEAEQGALVSAGYRPVSLGPAVLRIETACVALACILLSHCQARRPRLSSDRMPTQ